MALNDFFGAAGGIGNCQQHFRPSDENQDNALL